MKNKYKLKTQEERNEAFNTFCRSHESCESCSLNYLSHCTFAWLELEVKTIKDMISDLIKKVNSEGILTRTEMVKKLLSHRDKIQQIWQAQDKEEQNGQ